MALYLWLLEISPVAGTMWVCLFAALVFIPFKYVYPSRMPVWRRTTNVLAGVWMLVMAFAVTWPDRARSGHLVEASLFFPAWYVGLSVYLGGMRRRSA